MQRILIIGGSGILSSAVVDACIENGNEVTMMNRGNNSVYTNPQAKLIICDARNEDDVRQKTKDLHFDVVIDFIVYNLEQLKRSLSLFGHIANQYIFISSAQVYNTSIQKEHLETDETPQKLWKYSVNKDICEHYLRDYCASEHINYTIIRPGVNYDNRRIPYGMYPPIGMHWTMVARILAGKPIITWNNGENKLNLTRVEDFAKGVVGLLGNKKAYNEAFNVVGDYIYSWKQVLEVLGKLLNIEVKTIDIPLQTYANELKEEDKEMLIGGRACDLVCSNAKLKSIVPDYHSAIDLESGIRKTLDWYQANNYYNGFDYRWDAEQDRIIQKFYPHEPLRFINYSPSTSISKLKNRCNYMVEFHKGNKILGGFWKAVRKFVYKPLNKFCQ
ncbi:MAG: NAD-dependent epimerase/dehydratase family protein [Bacteroidales bacterium]|nr:NAD-dependent epimerase/dehydratase family protein [Bacteroidales bacterium]